VLCQTFIGKPEIQENYVISEDDLVEGVKVTHTPIIAVEMMDLETIT
jgi:hypothetical protein